MKGLLYTTFLSGPLQNSDVSFVISEGGQEFLSHQSQLPLVPASNMKLVISAAGLLQKKQIDLFPPLLTYAHGIVSGGILDGNLILDSCGSLIFSARFPATNDFKSKNELLRKQIISYARQLKASGIKTINGDLELTFKRWNAPFENTHYTAAAAFSFNENTVDTLVTNNQLKTVPQQPSVFNFKSTDEVDDQDKAENNLIRYNPKVDSRDYWRLSKSSATAYALSMLKKELGKEGIKILGNKIKLKQHTELLFETKQLFGINEFIKPLNMHSDNFRAELLALLLNRLENKKAIYPGLNESIHTTLKENDLNLKSLRVEDGSGLSRKNRVSAGDIHQLLMYMEGSNCFSAFKDSMSIAGRTGTLKKRFKGSIWEGSFYGKTGTLNGVSALSGYWLRNNKPTITFAFIGNGAENEVFWNALEKFAASLKFLA